MESGEFIACVELIEQTIKAEQSFVRILGSKIHAMVVIPQRTQCFIDITVRLVIRVKPSQDIGIILIAKMAGGVEVARIAVAFRRVVGVVQVRGNRWKPEAGVVRLVHGRQ